MRRGRILCVGGATVDRSLRLAEPMRLATSNPVSGRRAFGGVARNVAENLAHLGCEVALLSAVGDDPDGRALIAMLETSGILAEGVAVLPGEPTAAYVAVLTPGGELALGLADMAILDGLTPCLLEAHAPAIRAAEWIFADCNLPAATIAFLADRTVPGAGYRLALDAVSVTKSARLPLSLAGIDLLMLNRDEADACLGRLGRTSGSPEDDAAALLGGGCGAVVLTLGARGAIAADANGTVLVDACAAEPVDVTGAGDALVAGTLLGLTRGRALAEAVAFGCRAAALAVRHFGAVNPGVGAMVDPSGS